MPLDERLATKLKIVVLGSAAGGGYPQWNCRCPVCDLAWQRDRRVSPRTQSSLAVTADRDHWFLLNASPDLRQQIQSTDALWPSEGGRDSPIRGVFLTNGDVDHVAGLLSLRERQAFTILGTPATLKLIEANSLFRVLDPAYVSMQPLQNGVEIDAGFGLKATPFFVPGKVPLHEEGGTVSIGGLSETTLGLEIRSDGARLVYIPGCAKMSEEILRRAAGADLLLFDGTTFTDDEMVRLGLSQKTAWRMGHMAIAGDDGSLRAFTELEVGRKIYTHINNTNPILIAGSPERRVVESAGWEVAYDGLEIAL
ncbi:MAG: pyrroloquinoline quinone biosynthesis protein PqqB [Hyphomicrobiales bacterium]|nr:pyrroloquinoline quinone biosynthesis protein PqqB [Hyphomicrobiales bacterium]